MKRLARALVTVTAALVATTAMPTAAAATACTYSVDPQAIEIGWTAFKLTDKVGVPGTFREVRWSGPTAASSLQDLARGLRVEIDGTSLSTGNPGRDATIAEYFFRRFRPDAKITGRAVSVEGDESSGTVDIEIAMNGTRRTVPFHYQIGDDHRVDARASIDVMDFALQGAFQSLHEACRDKHTGKDGVSKTWTDVEIHLKGAFRKECGGGS